MDSYSFMGTSISKIAGIYNLTNQSLWPYEYFKTKPSFYIVIGILTRENFKSSPTIKLPSQKEVDDFNKASSYKIGKELTLEYMHKYIYILQHVFSS